MFKKLLRKEEGFTMVEMMVVLIIIAVLIAGGVKAYLGYINNAKITKTKAAISTMQASLDAYYAENNDYPLTADVAKAGLDLGDTKDAWGGAYTYICDVADATTYTLYGSPQTIAGVATQVVLGTGDDGASETPTIEDEPE